MVLKTNLNLSEDSLDSIDFLSTESSVLSTKYAPYMPTNGITTAKCPFLATSGIKIKNITTSQIITDSLHHKSLFAPCDTRVCLGSVMGGSTVAHENHHSATLDQAKDFLDQYFAQLKNSEERDSIKRFGEIKCEYEQTGTFTLTAEELLFGAKTAWRNASRCIGRIQWNKLELQDARHIRTTKQMFDCICKHIEFATNNGNLRSMITIFPQRVSGRDDYRIWNAQLLNFAGYLQPDGSVIGDPIRVQFTKICQKLGWKGKGGKFDILPIVLSAPGESPKFYELPDSIILRVPIEHPNYGWLKDMDLQWYALPAVAEMMFDCAGLEFTAAPFNGWYMGTEIGARNFCDPQRYNLTEQLAIKMGLDIANPTTLWKDKVLVEINIAVLYSFQKAGVTIVDHHTASESFIKHMHSEEKQRGGCPADWVWIVPPISGSITPVFHQEMINYQLKPSYEYQENAWKTHVWTQPEIKLKYRFSSVSKAALWTVMLLSRIASKRVKATILYSTETGKSETMAHKLEKLMKLSFCVNTQCMEDYKFDGLAHEKLVLVVTSTFGNGEAPDNGKEFWKQLYKLSAGENKSILSGVKYGVFALGSSNYQTFCSFGKKVDNALGGLGATQLLSIGLGDELKGQERAFQLWANNCFTACCKQFGLNFNEEALNQLSTSDESAYEPNKIRLVITDEIADEKQVPTELAKLHRKPITSCKMVSKVRLQPQHSERQTLLVSLTASRNQIDKNAFNYEAGDHLAVCPRNPPEMVSSLLAYITENGYDNTDNSILRVERLVNNSWTQDTRLPLCSIETALTYYLDITTPPTQQFLGYLVDMAKDDCDSMRLKQLSNSTEEYDEWRAQYSPHLAHVLSQFKSLRVKYEFLCTQLPLLQPRYYSISSSRKVANDRVDLTMSVVRYNVTDGSVRHGVCTNFFDNYSSNGDIYCFLRSAPNFRLPDDGTAPVIMIGAGSGIAPFRGFWQQREALVSEGERYGDMYLIFGCRDSAVDNIYGKEITALLEKRVLTGFYLALSREKGVQKKYVQHIVGEQCCDLIYRSLIAENGHIYVCGDTVMATAVQTAIIKVIESVGKMGETDAKEVVNNLVNNGRYHEDVFGIKHI